MKTTAKIMVPLLLMLMAGISQATPVMGTIAEGISLIHDGAVPSGTGNPDYWRRFSPGQQIELELANGILTLHGPQAFSLFVPAVESAGETVIFLDMSLNLNAEDGFAGGHLAYTLNGIDVGFFLFPDFVFNNSGFNTSRQVGNTLEVFLWGADPQNQLGMDFALSVVLAEPATLALLMFGMVGLALTVRRRSVVRIRR